MWLSFALLSGFFYTIQGLLTRHVLKGIKKDAWAFSFYFSAVGALISLPFMLQNFQVGYSVNSWIIMLIVGLLIVAQNLLYFKSSNHIPASVNGSITKFRLVWIFILGILILNESLSLGKTIGTLLTVIAGILIIKKSKEFGSVMGIIYSFSATIFYAIVIILYKFLFKEFNSQSLTFFIFFIPAVINLIKMPNSLKRITHLAQTDGMKVFIACTCGAFANLAMNYSLSLGETSRVIVIIESFLVITLVGEAIFLKEKDGLMIKIIAVLLAVFGAILLKV